MKAIFFLLPALILGMTCCSTKPAELPSGPEVQASDIIRQLQGGAHVSLQGKKIIGDLDFTTIDNAYHEGMGVYRCEVPGSVTFIECQFTGEVRAFRKEEKSVRQVSFLRNLSFLDCRFEQPVDLRMMVVEGDSRWQKSVFQKEVQLTGATFERSANFKEADFIGPFQAQDVQFTGRADFMDAVWENTATFQAAQFHQEAQFGVARFLDYVEFNSVWAQRAFLFSYAQFHGRAFFKNARFDDRTEFFKATFHQTASLANSRFAGEVKLQEVAINENLSLEKCRFARQPEGWTELEKNPAGTVNLTGTQTSH